MALWLRRLVSGQKKRFQDDGFDLDLAYIAPRLIAMGLPAQGKQVLYRNPMQEIASFLHTYHASHAKVYNLCSEHQYSPERLSVPVQAFPFDDHQTPALLVLQQFCADAAAWLASHPANVVVVHCKAGKGRTGIMICCLLLYLHLNAPNLPNLLLPPTAALPAATAAAAAAQPPGPGCDTAGLATLAAAAAAMAAAAAAAAAGAPPAAASPDGAADACGDASGAEPVRSAECACTSSAGGAGGASDGAAAAGQGMWAVPFQLERGVWHPWQVVQPVQLQQLEQPVRDVLAVYAERRTHDGNGVTIASQRRYIRYFWRVLARGPRPLGTLPAPRRVQLRRISVAGLPPGSADSCEVLVEARPSGSTQPRGALVWLGRSAPKAAAGGVAGLCLVPCAQPPLVHDDSCSISCSPAGSTLAFTMPASSLGLRPIRHGGNGSSSAGNAAGAAAATAGANRWCSGCGSTPGCCLCWSGQVTAQACDGSDGDDGAAAAADDGVDAAEQGGSCIVEGDVRVMVVRSGLRLFSTWLNTAFLPPGGAYVLAKHELDKPVKSLPGQLTLTLRYVDVQPTAEPEAAEAAGGQRDGSWAWEDWDEPLGSGAKQQQQQQPHNGATGGSAVLPQQQQQQQQQQQGCGQPQACAGPAADSISAPASPLDELRSSSDWQQGLPAISSISASAVLCSAAAGSAPAATGHLSATCSWGSDAALSWDWCDSLLPAAAAAAASKCHSAAPQQGSKAAAAGPADRAVAWAPAFDRPHSSPAAAGPAAVEPPLLAQRTASGKQWHVARSWLPHHRSSAAGGQGRRRGSSVRDSVSELHSGLAGGAASRAASPRGAASSSGGSRCSSTAGDQGAIELPVILRGPLTASSTVAALLDLHQPGLSSAAAAAEAAVLADNTQHHTTACTVAGTGAAAAAASLAPGMRVRKGYSWSGSHSWLAAAGMPAGAEGTRSSGSVRCSPFAAAGAAPAVGGAAAPAGAGPRLRAASASEAGDKDDGRGTQAGGHLDPLPQLESPTEPPPCCADEDPLQGLLEALNWSTDMQRYSGPRQRHAAAGGTASSSTRAPAGRSAGPGAARRSGGGISEPASPARHRSGRPGLPPGLQPLQHAHSAPPAPPAPNAAARGVPQQPPSEGAGQCGPAAAAPVGAAAASAAAEPGEAACRWHAAQRSRDQRPRGTGWAGYGKAPSRRARPDAARLLDLEDCAEEEEEEAGEREQQGQQGRARLGHACAAEGPRLAGAAATTGGAAPHQRPVASPPPPPPAAAAAAGYAGRAAAHASASKQRDQAVPLGLAAGPTSSGRRGAAAAGSMDGGSSGGPSAFGTARRRRQPRAGSPGALGRTGGEEELLQGLLADDDTGRRAAGSSSVAPAAAAAAAVAAGAPSCAAEAPSAVQQWQQLERAWQRSWWV